MTADVLAGHSEETAIAVFDILERRIIGLAQFACNIKTEAGAVGCRGEKRFKQLLDLMCGNTGAVIFDVQVNAVGMAATEKPDCDTAILLSAVPPGIAAQIP